MAPMALVYGISHLFRCTIPAMHTCIYTCICVYVHMWDLLGFPWIRLAWIVIGLALDLAWIRLDSPGLDWLGFAWIAWIGLGLSLDWSAVLLFLPLPASLCQPLCWCNAGQVIIIADTNAAPLYDHRIRLVNLTFC